MKKVIGLILSVSCIFMTTTLACMASESTKDGWQYTDSNWYYYNNGKLLTGWIRDNSYKWYYLDDNGAMLANTVTPDGYILDQEGVWIPDAQRYWDIDFTEYNIDKIEFYNIPVPAAAQKKVVTEQIDITQIYNNIVNAIAMPKDSKSDEQMGGNYKIVIIQKDQSKLVLTLSSSEISYKENKYSLNRRISVDELWEGLHYNTIDVPQNEIP